MKPYTEPDYEDGEVDGKPLEKRRANCIPSSIIFYDIECESQFLNPILVMFTVWENGDLYLDIDYEYDVQNVVDGQVFWGFTGYDCINKFRDFLLTARFPSRRCYLMSYNGSNFDDLFLFSGWDLLNHNSHFMHTTTSITQGCFSSPTNYFITRDLRKFLTEGSLADLGKKVQLPKLDSDVTTICVANISEYIPYCCRDVNIMLQAYCNLLLPSMKVDGDILQCPDCVLEYVSISALTYQETILSVEDCFILPEELKEYGKQSYYGAKIDTIMAGQHREIANICFDITSMYPAAATSGMPAGPASFFKERPSYFEEWETWLHHKSKMYCDKPFLCTVRLYKVAPDHCGIRAQYGTLPWKDSDGITYYLSHGDIEGVYTCFDIYQAMCDGWRVKSSKNYIVWQRWEHYFHNLYHDMFLQKKQYDKDTFDYAYAKRLMNGGVGSFCQRIDPCRTKPSQFGWFILSASRMFLACFLHICTAQQIPRILYGDTDSIFIEAQFKKAFEEFDGGNPLSHLFCDRLGSMFNMSGKWEGEGAKEIVVIGKKAFHTGVKCAHKGHRKITLAQMKSAMFSPIETEWVCPWKRKIKNVKGTLYCFVGTFCKRTRKFQVVRPKHKQQCDKCKYYFNKFIVSRYNKV